MNKKQQQMIGVLNAIDLQEIENKTCCGLLEAWRQAGFEWPFDRPLGYRDGTIKVLGWNVNMMPRLDSGKPDARNKIRVVLDYCPFCGAHLNILDKVQP